MRFVAGKVELIFRWGHWCELFFSEWHFSWNFFQKKFLSPYYFSRKYSCVSERLIDFYESIRDVEVAPLTTKIYTSSIYANHAVCHFDLYGVISNLHCRHSLFTSVYRELLGHNWPCCRVNVFRTSGAHDRFLPKNGRQSKVKRTHRAVKWKNLFYSVTHAHNVATARKRLVNSHCIPPCTK